MTARHGVRYWNATQLLSCSSAAVQLCSKETECRRHFVKAGHQVGVHERVMMWFVRKRTCWEPVVSVIVVAGAADVVCCSPGPP